MSKSQRDKGKLGELEVVHVMADYGFQCWRTPNSGAMHYAKGDVNGIPGLHIEVKRQETLKVSQWSRQATADCPEGQTPIVVYRTSREPWRVVIDLHDFMDLYVAATSQTEVAA